MRKWLMENPGRDKVQIHDGCGTLVARVDKTLYVRRKPPARQA
ncbi:hypothetical protein C4J93_5134 [Pseudomonas sp. R2-37-08W]|nr:hypothetical protein C4J93_5134 [Pseudomonas sp. R2-37-08W]AZF50277.1 hypothetical protein C4J86_5090 [Pseudomonas sp. R2-7-07]